MDFTINIVHSLFGSTRFTKGSANLHIILTMPSDLSPSNHLGNMVGFTFLTNFKPSHWYHVPRFGTL